MVNSTVQASKYEIAGGYAGQLLQIDLTTGKVEVTKLDPQFARDFLGGRGFGAKLMYDMIKPGIDPLGPENVLTFGMGPLMGSMAPAASRVTAMAKSPLSGFIGCSNSGVNGTMLKRAGYDQLTILGKADAPSYLKIVNDSVEICDASHLWGKDAWETTEALLEELGTAFWVSAIGPAGENLVKFASIQSDFHGAFGRTGLGAVMGSKNLKAIAVYGSKPLRLASTAPFMGKAKKATKQIFAEYGDVIKNKYRKGGNFPNVFHAISKHRAHRPRDMEIESNDPDNMHKRFDTQVITCPGCPVGCKSHWITKGGRHDKLSFPVSCSAASFIQTYGTALSIKDLREVGYITDRGQKLGVDSMTMEAVITLANELYEAELIGTEETGGLELKWGDPDVAAELIRLTANREGFGEILADGPIAACIKLGLNPDDHCITYKGSRVPLQCVPDIRSSLSLFSFGLNVNVRGVHGDSYRVPPTNFHPDEMVATVSQWAKHIGVPADVIENELFQEIAGRGEGYNVPLFATYAEYYNMVAWSMGLCDRHFVMQAYSMDDIAEEYSLATGIPITGDEIKLAGERIWNIQKAFNVREGAARKDDCPPERLFREPFYGYTKTWPPFEKDAWKLLLDTYYVAHRWDMETGVPTKETLGELGLEDVAEAIGAR